MERVFKRSLNRKIRKLVTKRLRLNRVNTVVTQQRFADSSDSTDVESITSCNQSSEDDNYNIIHKDQNEQNNIEHIDRELNLSKNKIDIVDAEIASAYSDNGSSFITSKGSSERY